MRHFTFHRIGLIVSVPTLFVVVIVVGLFVGLMTGYDFFRDEWNKP